MLRQIQYFQAVVRNNSFSEAAEECHISQSAISQQVQALERELGFRLLERKNRRFTLTPAGEYFYQKSLILVADYERICRESARIAHGKNASLRVGCLRSYSGREFYRAVEQFAREYPGVSLEIQQGNHEELYRMLQEERLDLALNDQRRAFSDAFVNLILATAASAVELSAHSPLAELKEIEPGELKNLPCILVASKEQQETEREYYRDIVGFPGEFLCAETLEAARLLAVSGRGFLPVEGSGGADDQDGGLVRIPLVRGGEQITRNYCAFWKKDNSGYYVETFAEILKQQYKAAE